jgi:hypothetical protein
MRLRQHFAQRLPLMDKGAIFFRQGADGPFRVAQLGIGSRELRLGRSRGIQLRR